MSRNFVYLIIISLVIGSGCSYEQTSNRNYTFYKEIKLPIKSDSQSFYIQQSNYEMQKDFSLPQFEFNLDENLDSEIVIKLELEAFLTTTDAEPIIDVYTEGDHTKIYVGSLERKDFRLRKYNPDDFQNYYLVRRVSYSTSLEDSLGIGFTISY